MKIRSLIRHHSLRLVALVCIGLVVGPEIGIGAEAVALLDVMGAELFLLAYGGAHLMVYWERIKRYFERIDPFFFVPTRAQISSVPGIAAHAVPFLVLVIVFGYVGAVSQINDI